MRIAIVANERTAADVLVFAAQRRGHSAISLDGTADLHGRLPFDAAVVFLGGNQADVTAEAISEVKARFADAGVFAILESPRDPVPSRLLAAGATDVVRTPYNPVELIIRAENWLSTRDRSTGVDDTLRVADIELALDRYAASKNGIRLNLTRLELRLLYCLCQHQPHLTPMERLLTFGWDERGEPDAALVKTHISHLRSKLEAAGGMTIQITSRQTLGYTLTFASASTPT